MRKKGKSRWPILKKSVILTSTGTTKWWIIRNRPKKWKLRPSNDINPKWLTSKRKLKSPSVNTKKNQEKLSTSERSRKPLQSKKNILKLIKCKSRFKILRKLNLRNGIMPRQEKSRTWCLSSETSKKTNWMLFSRKLSKVSRSRKR